jgi:subtilisin-like proprotein convertase family protein
VKRLYSVLVHGFGTETGDFQLSAYEGGGPTTLPVACSLIEVGACCIEEYSDPVSGRCEVLSLDQCAADGGQVTDIGVGCFAPNGKTHVAKDAAPVPIPDGTGERACSTIEVSAPWGCESIADLDVGVIVTHSAIGDLEIWLTGPNGSVSRLWFHQCSGTDNMDIYFDDEGTDNSCGVLRRLQPALGGGGPPFSLYDDIDPSGAWELCIEDRSSDEVGTLERWSLEIDCGSSVCQFSDPVEPPRDVTPGGGSGRRHGIGLGR